MDGTNWEDLNVLDVLNYDKSDSLKHVQSEAKVMSPSLSFCDLYYS